jgi:hypothetical protein
MRRAPNPIGGVTLHRASRPWIIEVWIVLAVLLCLAAMLVAMGPLALRAAAFTEVQIGQSYRQHQVVEHVALRGELPHQLEALDFERSDSEAGESSRAELSQSFRRVSLGREPQAPGSESATGPSGVRVKAERSAMLDGSLVTIGRFGAAGPSFGWVLRPVVLVGAPPQSVVWACGVGTLRPPWTGASAPGVVLPADLRSSPHCAAEHLP